MMNQDKKVVLYLVYLSFFFLLEGRGLFEICFFFVDFFQTPGKPYVLGISSNSVQLKWDKSVENPKNYRIHSVNFNKWYCTDSNEIHIPDLVKKTQYKFQVHGDFEDGLGPSSLRSEDIEIPDCIKDSHGFWKPSGTGYPFKYMVPLNEKIERTAKMRTMTIGIVFIAIYVPIF